MSFPERNGSQATAVSAAGTSSEWYPIFDSIKFSIPADCTEVLIRSTSYKFVGRLQDGRFERVEGTNGNKPRRLEESPQDRRANLTVVSIVSSDNRVFLHESIVSGGSEEIEAYCASGGKFGRGYLDFKQG